MWVARDRNGQLWLYESKPRKHSKNATFWNSDDGAKSMIMKDDNWNSFSTVKWEDEEPTELIIKKGG